MLVVSVHPVLPSASLPSQRQLLLSLRTASSSGSPASSRNQLALILQLSLLLLTLPAFPKVLSLYMCTCLASPTPMTIRMARPTPMALVVTCLPGSAIPILAMINAPVFLFSCGNEAALNVLTPLYMPGTAHTNDSSQCDSVFSVGKEAAQKELALHACQAQPTPITYPILVYPNTSPVLLTLVTIPIAQPTPMTVLNAMLFFLLAMRRLEKSSPLCIRQAQPTQMTMFLLAMRQLEKSSTLCICQAQPTPMTISMGMATQTCLSITSR